MKSSWWMFERQMMGALMDLFEPWIFAGFEAITKTVRIFSPTFDLPGEGTEGSIGIKPWALNLHTCPQSIPKATSFTYFDFISLSLSLSLPLCSHFRHQSRCCNLSYDAKLWLPGKSSSSSLMRVLKLSTSLPVAGKVREVSRCLWKLKLRWETTITSNNIQ